MRIIEPSHLKRRSIKKKKSHKRLYLILVLFSFGLVFVWTQINPKKIDSANDLKQVSNTSVKGVAVTEVPKKNTLKEFSNTGFVDFYGSFAYPNTSEIISPTVITGNPEADKRIQSIAEKRGYKLRNAPISAPVSTFEGMQIQQKAQQPLADLFTEAKKAGHILTLTAAFRSVDDQRELFVGRLNAKMTDIALGLADASVEETLKTTAPPGYSRHHNGFTIDIACGNVGGMAFLETDCFAWLSKDNFKMAKEFGWIPSYPDGASSVGPEPEPWEYVWVSKGSLLE